MIGFRGRREGEDEGAIAKSLPLPVPSFALSPSRFFSSHHCLGSCEKSFPTPPARRRRRAPNRLWSDGRLQEEEEEGGQKSVLW